MPCISFLLVDNFIDKQPQAVEKDADFVISSPSEGFPESELASFWGFLSAYKGTTGLERAKS